MFVNAGQMRATSGPYPRAFSRLNARVVLVMATLFAGAVPHRAAADDDRPRQSEGDRRSAADSLYSAGTLAFREKRYEDALDNFEQSYRLFPDSVLLYNIALTYELLLRPAQALKTYQMYLDAMPDAENRAAVEERMRIIRGTTSDGPAPAPSEQPTPQTPAAPPTAEQPEDTSREPEVAVRDGASTNLKVLPKWAFWTSVGVTGAVSGVAFWQFLELLDAKDRYDADQTQENKDKGLEVQRRANILIGAAAGCAVLTAVAGIFFTDWDGEQGTGAHALRITPSIAPSAASLTVSAAF